MVDGIGQLSVKVKLAFGYGKNVKSNVENYVDLSIMQCGYFPARA